MQLRVPGRRLEVVEVEPRLRSQEGTALFFRAWLPIEPFGDRRVGLLTHSKAQVLESL